MSGGVACLSQWSRHELSRAVDQSLVPAQLLKC